MRPATENSPLLPRGSATDTTSATLYPGKIERLEVPREREGAFVTEVFERYKRMTGNVEEAILEMYLSRTRLAR